jgi:hypothetical protein
MLQEISTEDQEMRSFSGNLQVCLQQQLALSPAIKKQDVNTIYQSNCV